ncbi:hypothetical protein DPMN_024183 [Dreissena polymorpha]|uniref:Uncharacterized protein n=1 Tax=Dreissena polymorpha TaxID=45954 RepID=A0A9D4RAJ6_DREPO|nr:hypothetical protein DPMN_024183 [Dreissena polymorpha]
MFRDSDKTPSYKADDADKMIYMVFDRRHAADDILFFIRPNTTGLVCRNQGPPFEDLHKRAD